MTAHQPNPGTTRQTELDAARLLLGRMGLSPADLLAAPQDKPPMPTFAEYIPQVRAAVGEGTRRMYGSYWNRILDRWGTAASTRSPHRTSASSSSSMWRHWRAKPEDDWELFVGDLVRALQAFLLDARR